MNERTQLGIPSEETKRRLEKWQKEADSQADEWWKPIDQDDEFIEREMAKGDRYDWRVKCL